MRPSAWTQQEIVFLKQNYGQFGAKHVAQHTGRTVQAVWQKARDNGIKYSPRDEYKSEKITRAEFAAAHDTKSQIRKQIGEAIENKRLARGLKVSVFARMIGVRSENYSQIVRNGCGTLDTLTLYAVRAGLSVSVIVGGGK